MTTPHRVDDDPRQPQASLTAWVFATLVVCAAFGDFSTGLLTPAMPVLGTSYGASPLMVQGLLVSFAVMFALGQLFFGPFSDRRGRRQALIIGAWLTLVGSLCAGLADELGLMIAGRAVQGLGAGAGYVVARAMVRDLYGPSGVAKAMALLFTLMATLFLLAPLLGGVLLTLAGWRAGFFLAAAIAAAWLASARWIMPETTVLSTAPRGEGWGRTYLRLFRSRSFVGYLVIHATAYGGLYCFVAGASYVFIQGQGLAPASFGTLAAMVMSGFLLGALAVRHVGPKLTMHQTITWSLLLMFSASLCLVALAHWAWLPAPALIALEVIFWFGAGTLAPNTAAGVMLAHPQATGAAAAVLGFVQMCMAGVAAVVQGLIFDGTALPMVAPQAVFVLFALVSWRRHQARDA